MRCIGYIRVSTDQQSTEGVSLAAQREKIEQYAALKDMHLVGMIEDAGISAKNLNRPGVQNVIEMVKQKQVDAVVVFKLDRMFRSTVDALETAKLFDSYGVALHSINESLDTQSAMGRFFFTLTAALAEMERALIGERTKVALQHKKTNGKVYGQVPYGFRRDGDDLVEAKDEQTVIEEVLRLRREERWTLRAIASHLNKNGYKTKNGGIFYPATIKSITMRVKEKGTRHGS